MGEEFEAVRGIEDMRVRGCIGWLEGAQAHGGLKRMKGESL
ncbi:MULTISPECIES: hypothetical protein [Bartonella]|nr:hypothetical protein [Bartonella capreoli]